MTVEDVFSIRGRGTVLTGRVDAGPVAVGDEVWINGQGPFRVQGIEAFRKVLKRADAGDMIGLLVGVVDRDQVKRGDIVSSGGL
jgi:elongation factor Tu